MEDIVTRIENEIATRLLSIDQAINSNGYQYFTKTGTVMIYDQTLSKSKNRDNGDTPLEASMRINYRIEQQEGEEPWSDEDQDTCSLTNDITFTIRAIITLEGTETHKRRAFQIRSNNVLSDLKALFSYDIYDTDIVNYSGSDRLIYDDNNVKQYGELQFGLDVTYSQDALIPTNKI